MEELDKDATIIDVLKRLRSRLGSKAFVISDNEDWDPLVISIASPYHAGVSIFFSTFDQPEDHFWYELEIPPPRPNPNNSLPYVAVGRGTAKSFDELAEIVAKHLRYYG